MTNPSLDAYQQVFGMACIVGRAAGYTGTQNKLQLQLQYDLSFYLNNVPPVSCMKQTDPSTADPSVTPVLGSWNLVWGPAVLEEIVDGLPTGVADNALFVAQCNAVQFPGGPSMPVYVVAISGTNPDSAFDWKDEDFAVSTVVNWNTYNPSDVAPSPYDSSKPFISQGTAVGVGNLLGLISPNTAAAPGTSLEQFLAGAKTEPHTALIFCGHSLAGALSPTLALYLQTRDKLGAFETALVYPTAGPTPGEVNFAALFNSTFPALPSGWEPQTLPYQSWNTMHWNELDVVPHAWQKEDLEMIANIYGHSPKPYTAATLSALQAIAVNDASKSGAAYTRIRNSSLPGTLQKWYGQIQINVPPQSMDDYVHQLALQHINMYSGIKPSLNNPAGVPGLVLPQPLPESTLTGLVPGVVPILQAEIIKKTNDQITGWIAAHVSSEMTEL